MIDDPNKTPIPPSSTARTRATPRPTKRTYTMRAAVVGVGAAAMAVGLLGCLLSVGIFMYYQALGLIVPGVHVGAVQLGGLSVDGATAELEQAWSGGEEITLTAGEQTWKAAPEEFGLSLDAQATAERAAAVAHGDSLVDNVSQMIEGIVNGISVNPVVALDEAKARDSFSRVAPTINREPENASLAIDGDRLVAVPGKDGYQIDVDATVRNIAIDPGAVMVNGNIPVVLLPIAPRAPDASVAIAQATQYINGPLEIVLFDPIKDETIRQTAQPTDIAAWLTIEASENGPEVIVDPDKVAAYASQFDQLLGEDRYIDPALATPVLLEALATDRTATLMISRKPTQYTVQPGDTMLQIGWDTQMPYWRILEANPGVDANTIDVGDVLTIPSKNVLLPLPVVMNKRIVLSISDQRVWAYQDGQVVYEFVVSTGIDRSPTQPGVFQVQTHEIEAYASIWDLYMPHFMGIYEAWPGFMNGFHGLPLLSSGVRLWGDVLGNPASFGCIILDLDDGETLYNWAEDGVVVEIQE